MNEKEVNAALERCGLNPPAAHGTPVCQFACEHNCTLVGHAYEALRFLNQCLEHGIVKTAVEGDPDYNGLWREFGKFMATIKQREK